MTTFIILAFIAIVAVISFIWQHIAVNDTCPRCHGKLQDIVDPWGIPIAVKCTGCQAIMHLDQL